MDPSAFPGGIGNYLLKSVSSCEHCRKSKLSCDLRSPCDNCIQKGKQCLFTVKKRKKSHSQAGEESDPKRLRRDSSPEIFPGTGTDDVRASATFAVLHFLRSMLGSFSSKFKVNYLPADGGIDKQLDKTSKLCIFSALSCSARAFGNLTLAEKFYTYARQVARDLYDVLERPTSPIGVALGFTWLSIATSSKNLRRASHYATIAFNTSDRVEPHLDDVHQKVLFFIRVHYYSVIPCEPLSSLYYPVHGTAPVACGYSLFTAVTPEVAKVLSEIFILGHEVENCMTLPNEARGKIDTFMSCLPFEAPGFTDSLFAMEFLHFLRYLTFFHLPRVREVYETDNLKEDLSHFSIESFPRGLALVLLCIIDRLTPGFVGDANVLTISYFRLFQCLFYMVLVDFENWLEAVEGTIRFMQAPENKARLLLSPSFSSPPAIFLGACVLFHCGLIATGDKCLEILEIFANRNYANATSGIAAARASRERAISRINLIPSLNSNPRDRFRLLLSRSAAANASASASVSPSPPAPGIPTSSLTSPSPRQKAPPLDDERDKPRAASSASPTFLVPPTFNTPFSPVPPLSSSSSSTSPSPILLPALGYQQVTANHRPIDSSYGMFLPPVNPQGPEEMDLGALVEMLSAHPSLQELLATNGTLLDFVSMNSSVLNYFIQHPNILPILASHPTFLTIVSSNEAFLALVARNPTLLSTVVSNPSIINIVISNPSLLDIVVTNPSILNMVLTNPNWLSMVASNPMILGILSRVSSRNSSANNGSSSAQAPPTEPSSLSLLSVLSSFATPFFSRTAPAPQGASNPSGAAQESPSAHTPKSLASSPPSHITHSSPSSVAESPSLSSSSSNHGLTRILESSEEVQMELLSNFWASVKEEAVMREIELLWISPF